MKDDVCLLVDAAQAVFNLMGQVKEIVSLRYITGSMVLRCCAGKPKKSTAGTACCLKHAEVTESGDIEATMQQTIKGRVGLVVAMANPSGFGSDNMQATYLASLSRLGALKSCCAHRSEQMKTRPTPAL